MTHRVLLIDDEPDLLELLGITMSRMGLEVDTASCVRAALTKLAARDYDLCLTDMRLPDGDGIDVIKYGQRHRPSLPMAMITAHGDVETATDALKLGAFDFLNKPVEMARLKALIDSALKTSAQPEEDSSQQLIGDADNIRELRSAIAKVARNQAPVFIKGESGSGKELVAKLVHQLGPRKDAPFVPINCGAIPSELMESELFGHKKGAFTSATNDKIGLFEAATGGTLFLDEIGDQPLPMQVKLLRAIQEKKVRPVGSQQEINVDVRLLSATHKDLNHMVSLGEFRADLYYRLNVIELNVPPLRQHTIDLPLLTRHLLDRMQQSQLSLTPQALQALMDYPFPGNIRELENILERAVALCDSERIDTEHLHFDSHQSEDHSSQPSAKQTHNAAFPTPQQRVNDAGEAYLDLEEYLAEIEKK
ncbi:MAG: hypothetical protein RL336_1582, partial [Pseudomonadota bacterium]